MKSLLETTESAHKANTPIVKGEAFLAQCDANKFDFGKNEEYILERADEAAETAENRLEVYRKAKAVAERSGIGFVPWCAKQAWLNL